MNFIQQAYKGKNDWYHYFASIIIIAFFWQFLGAIPLLIGALGHTQDMTTFMEAAANNFLDLGMDKNTFLILIILMFAFGLVGLFFCVKLIHKRSIKTLFTSRKKIDWGRFFFAFFLWGTIAVILTFVGIYLEPENYIWNFKLQPFLGLVCISLLLLPLQTSFEELLFRGYLMQGFGTWFKNRWSALLLTSVIFGLLHGANPEVAKIGNVAMVFYIGTGLLYGITTLLDEGAEVALGLHAANNIVAALIATADWTALQTNALYVDTSEPSAGWQMFIPVFVLYPLLLVILSKKYGWKNWKEKLFGTIKIPESVEQTKLPY